MDNGYTAAQRWVDECERHEKHCQDIMIEAAAKCQPYKVMIREAKAAAKEEGISTKVLTAALLERKHLRNAAKVRDKLDDEDLRDELDEMRRSLEPVAGLPLFGAAIAAAADKAEEKKAGRARAKASAVDSLTGEGGDDDESDEFERVGQENAARLASGIAPLN